MGLNYRRFFFIIGAGLITFLLFTVGQVLTPFRLNRHLILAGSFDDIALAAIKIREVNSKPAIVFIGASSFREGLLDEFMNPELASAYKMVKASFSSQSLLDSLNLCHTIYAHQNYQAILLGVNISRITSDREKILAVANSKPPIRDYYGIRGRNIFSFRMFDLFLFSEQLRKKFEIFKSDLTTGHKSVLNLNPEYAYETEVKKSAHEIKFEANQVERLWLDRTNDTELLNNSYLKEIVDCAESKKIKLFFVEMPTNPILANDQNKVYQDYTTEIANISTGLNVVYTNYIKDVNIKLEGSDFYDLLHLNKDGRAKYQFIIENFLIQQLRTPSEL
ncbi:hypothetical protein [Bdellovibrio reynosensis]|uniref:SGNH/GDSL hydrolase family protein n=1 Tax=Bdellovibrio reynosensis TaxID=2835041 RepID=A0ABY4CB88_9BACT|nr:hypothetical protein [Bdellovibrio reynosensis]UOF02242.1 hypothetical protein MNR06_04675 [Bdellovibrio reynosensis]